MRSALTLRKERQDGPGAGLLSRLTRGSRSSVAAVTPDVNKPAMGGRKGRASGWGSSSLQCCGQVADVADEQRPIRKFLPGKQSVRADERCSHAMRYRGDHVAGEVVADEQHLFRGASSRRQHEVVEDGVWLADPKRV